MPVLRREHSWGKWPLFLAGILAVIPIALQAVSQTQPTESQDAQAIDETWQRANSKYDSERERWPLPGRLAISAEIRSP